MKIRSHLDSILFIIFIHVNAEEYDEDFKKLVQSKDASKGTDVSEIFSALSERHKRTMLHE